MPMFTMEKPAAGKVFDAIEPGRYVVKAISWQAKEGKSNPDIKYIRWTLKITGEDKWNGRQLFVNTFYKGVKNTTQLYKMLKDINQDHTGSEFDPDSFLDKPFEVEVHYPIDKRTNEITKYPEVKTTFPFVSDLGSDFEFFK
jgi:hypothetical protein